MSTMTFFQALFGIFKNVEKHQKADSLISFTQTTRVEPIVMIDQRAQHLPYLPDALQSLLALFGAYYLQAAALRVNVGKINVGRFLNPLNPERPYLESRNAALECLVPATESVQSLQYGLTSPGQAALESLPADLRPALEAGAMDGYGSSAHDPDGDKPRGQVVRMPGSEKDKDDEKKPGKGGVSIGESLNKDIKEAANLSVGRLYTVEISDDGHKASIPVMIRLLSTFVPSDLLVHILSDGARVQSSSGKERWYAFKMKDLKFWRDLVFCQDLIDEHKKALLADNKGVYHNILDRRAGNRAATAIHAGINKEYEPTIGTASNMVVMTRESVNELEKVIGGKFDKFEVRQKVFEMSYLMIVAVIDAKFDHVTFYHRGIAQPSEMSVRDLKMASKGSGPDINELLKSLLAGQAPAF